MARKEPRKSGSAYPPINQNLPPLYISRRKERTRLGHRILDWTPAQKRSIHEARMQGRLVKPHRYRAGTAALKDIRHFQEYSTPYPQAAFPEVGEGDSPRLQNRFTIPVSGDTMSSRSSRGLSCRAVRRHQPVHHPCKVSHHHAQGHSVSQTNPRRASVVSHNHKQTFWSFSGPPQYSKMSSLRKAIRTCESLLQNEAHLNKIFPKDMVANSSGV